MSKLCVLLLGATGNLGLRLIPALLSHNHTVVAYVRNPPKLKSLLKPELLSPITIVKGDATDTAGIYRAIIEHNCNALVCAAGTVVLNPWGKATLPGISEAAADAAILSAKERGGNALRCWFLAGMSLLDYPDSTYFLAD
jgi:nucleoside-diphosphate-sugar epimerase